jgi:hypothetical protein
VSPPVETLSVSDNVSVYSDSESDICQLDGNDSVCLDNVKIARRTTGAKDFVSLQNQLKPRKIKFIYLFSNEIV